MSKILECFIEKEKNIFITLLQCALGPYHGLSNTMDGGGTCALKPYHGTKPWVVKYHGWERVASPFNAFMMNGRGCPLHLMLL